VNEYTLNFPMLPRFRAVTLVLKNDFEVDHEALRAFVSAFGEEVAPEEAADEIIKRFGGALTLTANAFSSDGFTVRCTRES